MPVHHRLRFLTFPMRASRLCSLWSGMRPLRFSGGYIARRRPGLVQDRRRAIWHRRTILLCRPEPGSAGRRGGRAAAPRSHRRSAFWRQRPSRERPRTACGRDVRARTQAERSWDGRRPSASRPPQYSFFRGSIPHPTRSLCTLRIRRCRDYATLASRRRATALPGPVFHRQDLASFA